MTTVSKKFVDADTEEINTGSSMSHSRAQEIIKQARTQTHANYWISDDEYHEALKVLGEE